MGCSRTPFALLLSVLLGCGDGSIELDFGIPSEYRDSVSSIGLRVIVPPPGNAFGCDDIAFGQVPEADQIASTVAENNSTAEESPALSDVPRDGLKLFVFEGRSDAGSLIVAGCAAVDGESPSQSRVVAEPALVVAAPSTGLSGELRSEIPVRVTDVANQPAAQSELRWTLTGPGSAPPTEAITNTDDDGTAFIAPQPPQVAGPVAVDFRVRWEQSKNDSLRAFQAPPDINPCGETVCGLPNVGDLTERATDPALIRAGNIGPNGELGFAVLSPRSRADDTREIVMVYHSPGQNPPLREVVSTTSIAGGAEALGLVTRGNRDVVFTLSGTQWIEMDPATGDLEATAFPMTGVTSIVPIPSCTGAGFEAALIGRIGTQPLILVDASRNPIESPLADAAFLAQIFSSTQDANRILPVAAGCVTDVAGDVLRTVTYRRGTALALAAESTTQVRLGAPPPGAFSLGVTRPLGNEPGRILATEITISGTRLARYRLSALGAGLVDLDPVGSDETPSLLQSADAGDVDGDGLVDYLGSIDLGDSDRVFASLAVPHLGGRLVGLSDGSDQTTRPRLLLVDVTGDDIDDVILVSAGQYAVFRSGPL